MPAANPGLVSNAGYFTSVCTYVQVHVHVHVQYNTIH